MGVGVRRGWTVNSGGIWIALREGGELRVDGFGWFGYR